MVMLSDIAIKRAQKAILWLNLMNKKLALRSIKRHIEGSMKRYEALKKIEI